jgi:DnaJ family protein A protein 5
LKWHPDKNQGEDTTKIFQDISEAFTVLSNPQERAWYDSHRDQILKGKNVDESKEDDSDQITKSKL